MKERDEQSCECGHIATEIDEGNGRLCLECWIMWDYALNRFDMSAAEYAAVPIKRRPDFLSDKLSGAILAGAQVQPEWTREVLYILDSIKKIRATAP